MDQSMKRISSSRKTGPPSRVSVKTFISRLQTFSFLKNRGILGHSNLCYGGVGVLVLTFLCLFSITLGNDLEHLLLSLGNSDVLILIIIAGVVEAGKGCHDLEPRDPNRNNFKQEHDGNTGYVPQKIRGII